MKRLSVYLSWLCLEEGRLQRFMLNMFRSTLTALFMGLCSASQFAAIVLGSVTDTKISLCVLSSCYSTIMTLAMMRGERLWTILHEIKSLVQVTEDAPGDKAWEARTRQRVVRLCTYQLLMTGLIVPSTYADMALTGVPFIVLWPLQPHAGAWGLPVTYLVSAAVLLVIALSIPYMNMIVSCFTCAAAGLHHALGRRLMDSAGATPEAVRDVILAHQRLRRLTLDFTDFFATNLTHLLVCSFCNSLLAYVKLLNSDTSTTTIGLLLPVVVTFLQLSYFSQELSDASLALQWSAFRVATGGEVGLPEARALRLTMLTAGRQPALSCKGLGRLSLEAARGVCRQFYSAINVLRSRD